MGQKKKSNRKNIGLFIIFFVLCLLAGFAIGKSGMVDGLKGMPFSEFLIRLGVFYLFFLLSVFIHIVAHEAGHMVAAFIRGWKFLSFMVMGVVLSKRGGHFHLSRFSLAGAGGQCRAHRLVPRHPSDIDALSANTLWPAMGNEQLLQLPQCRSLLHVEVWRIQGKEAGRGGYVTVQVGKATAGRFLTSSFFILHLICYLCN